MCDIVEKNLGIDAVKAESLITKKPKPSYHYILQEYHVNRVKYTN